MPERKSAKLPDTNDVVDLADFFDRTDTEELEWKDDPLEFRKPQMVQVSIRIPKEDLEAIKRAARKAGIGYTTFIRMLLRRAVETGK
ncbi:CopG family antitoxin [Ammonifex thiophilus]|nr:CopG family antitoxin [Ammonifex thiophilus]